MALTLKTPESSGDSWILDEVAILRVDAVVVFRVPYAGR